MIQSCATRKLLGGYNNTIGQWRAVRGTRVSRVFPKFLLEPRRARFARMFLLVNQYPVYSDIFATDRHCYCVRKFGYNCTIKSGDCMPLMFT